MKKNRWLIVAIAICALVWIWALIGCGHLTVAPKPVNAHAIAFSGNKQNAGVIDCDANGCKVDANWVAKYKQMEAEFKNTIADDANIKTEGDHYRVTYEIVNHFIDLKALERSGP